MCDKSEEKIPVRRSARSISKTVKVQSSPPRRNRSKSEGDASSKAQTENLGGCSWAQSVEVCKVYHDKEWGVPLYDDKKMFEFLLLETFQAGLSWLLILRKRENFRRVFHDFNVDAVAHMTEKDVERLVQDASIIRHGGKIRSAIGNAKAVVHMRDVEKVGICEYFWNWVGYKQIVNNAGELITRSDLSDKIAKDLKKRGFKFVGSTVIYSHLQAVGIINDHHPKCERFKQVQRLVREKPVVNEDD